MTSRTIESSVTFNHPFTLTALYGPHPAGTYRLVTDDELILGASFVTFRRMATLLHVPAAAAPDHVGEVVPVDQAELASALEVDGRT